MDPKILEAARDLKQIADSLDASDLEAFDAAIEQMMSFSEQSRSLVGIQLALRQITDRERFEDDPETDAERRARCAARAASYAQDRVRDARGLASLTRSYPRDEVGVLLREDTQDMGRSLARHLGLLVRELEALEAEMQDVVFPVTFSAVNRQMNDRLSRSLAGADNEEAEKQAWQIIKTLRAAGMSAKQIADWLTAFHWDPYPGPPRSKRAFENAVRILDQDGKPTRWVGNIVSEQEIDRSDPEMVVNGERGDDSVLVMFSFRKRRAVIDDITRLETVFLPDESGEFGHGRMVTKITKLSDGTFEVRQVADALLRRRDRTDDTPETVTVIPSGTQVIAFKPDRAEWHAPERLLRGRRRHGLIEDGRFDELVELADEQVRSVADQRT